MKTVHAIFENGVFRPTEPVDLPEHSEVECDVRVVNGAKKRSGDMGEIYRILSRSYETGEPDLSSRHNEHQP